MGDKDFTSKAFISNRTYRLIISLVAASLVLLVARHKENGVLTFMHTWITFAVVYLIFSWQVIMSCHPKEMRLIAKKADWGASFIFLFVLFSAFVGLFAIFFLLKSIPDESKRGLSLHILLSIISVFCSWTLIHTLFTLKYAHNYYEANKSENGDDVSGTGLNFPNEKEPDYLDFAYFSFVIGMTFQVSDVEITSRHIRRVSLLHAFISFIYNTVIVALSINIVSGLISK